MTAPPRPGRLGCRAVLAATVTRDSVTVAAHCRQWLLPSRSLSLNNGPQSEYRRAREAMCRHWPFRLGAPSQSQAQAAVHRQSGPGQLQPETRSQRTPVPSAPGGDLRPERALFCCGFPPAHLSCPFKHFFNPPKLLVHSFSFRVSLVLPLLGSVYRRPLSQSASVYILPLIIVPISEFLLALVSVGLSFLKFALASVVCKLSVTPYV